MVLENPFFVASSRHRARDARAALVARYGERDLSESDVIIALGGDGFALATLHRFLDRKLPVYGMNCGSVGFLMNDFSDEGLLERLAVAESAAIHPLRCEGSDVRHREFRSLAFNEVSLLRETRQAAKMRILIDGATRMSELIADGALVSTPAGSTAYNLSAHGPILPLDARILALTPISAFRPRRWRGALLPAASVIRFEILEPDSRPVSATADNHEFRDIAWIEIAECSDIQVELLFDKGRDLNERILSEQFSV
jgi:NAD+ kinase